jgi:hypothetical protein
MLYRWQRSCYSYTIIPLTFSNKQVLYTPMDSNKINGINIEWAFSIKMDEAELDHAFRSLSRTLIYLPGPPS